MSSRIACRTCGSSELSPIGKAARARRFAGATLSPPLDGGALYRCTGCDLVQRSPILTTAEYDALYMSAGDHWQHQTLRPDQIKVRDYVFRILPEGGKVLDIGCAAGALLASLGDRYDKFGIEPSTEAASKAAVLGVSMIGKSIEDLRAQVDTFDVISAVDVIEHVPDPLEFLIEIARHLKRGGEIVISTGNSRAAMWRMAGPSYYYSHHFEHISFISPEWCKFVGSRGFSVSIIDAGFRHELTASPATRVGGMFRFFAKFLLSLGERVVLMNLPTTARKLGPRWMVGQPGLFRDHMLISFRPSAPALS